MASDSFVEDLRNTRTLAQQLWGHCRDSHSSYKLLSASIKHLRNVLEELEELEILDEPLDVKLLVTRSRELLDRLDVSFQSYRNSLEKDVDENAIVDLKTGLDVIGQQLSSAYDAMATGEIPLKLDTSAIPNFTSHSSRWGSTSASVLDSGQELRTSTRTSSVYSQKAQGNSTEQMDLESPGGQASNDREHRDEKEVYDLGVAYLQDSTSKSPVTREVPSLDWKSPFASPDPMSISIEQASTIILRDDLPPHPPPPPPPPPNLARSRSITIPQPSFNPQTQAFVRQTRSQEAGWQNIWTAEQKDHETNSQPKGTEQSPMRLRAASESLQSPSQTTNSGTNHPTAMRLSATTSKEWDDSAPSTHLASAKSDAGHLSPDASSQVLVRRGRNDSGTSNTFLTRSGETGKLADDYDLERKELSVVIEADMSETDETDEATPAPPTEALDSSPKVILQTDELNSPPPPPTRTAPSPPKQRKIPKIPQRASSYRIVNAALSDESSDDDDVSSKFSSPKVSKLPLESHAEAEKISIPTDGSFNEETIDLSYGAKHERRRGKEKITHAQRVLMARSAYVPPTSSDFQNSDRSDSTGKRPAFTTQLSFENLTSVKRSGDKPALPARHMTLPSRYRPTKSEDGNVSQPLGVSEQIKNLNQIRAASSNGRAELPTIQASQGAIPQESQAAAAEKEVAPEIGLEVRNMNQLQSRKSRRISLDAALNVPDISEFAKTTTAVRNTGSSSSLASLSQDHPPSTPESEHGATGRYAPDDYTSDITDLDTERVEHIMHFFNNWKWDQAESYLSGYLESLLEQDQSDRARRVRHLLGVCASFQGQWNKSILWFLSVLRTPITDISQIDNGDCAAAYWLGDAYSLLNQRSEALLAYSIAEHGSLFSDTAEHGVSDCVNAEREAVRLGVSEADFKLLWSQEFFDTEAGGLHTILDTKVIPISEAHKLLETEPRRARSGTHSSTHETPFQLDQNKSRALALFSLNKSQYSQYHRAKIASIDFEPFSPWPMMYDPFFSMANVRRGRLLLYECDMLSVFNSNPDAKIPKSGPMSLNRMDCFTSPDLNWLIQTIRECLRMLEMEWSEVANVEGTWFVARYSFMKESFATTHYFSIALFKQTFKLRSGYGVEICPDGICAARIVRSGSEHMKGVHVAESKRIKKLIREYLEDAAKHQAKAK